VMQWAIDQAGLTSSEVAEAIGLDEFEIDAWLDGDLQPTEAQLKRLAKIVHRPLAIFFLPAPPEPEADSHQLRMTAGSRLRALKPEEIRQTRRARRMQKLSSWILSDRPDAEVLLPRAQAGSDPVAIGRELRAWTGIEVARQFEWEGAKQAFDDWRLVFESRGILVMQLQLGSDLRGLALQDKVAPVIAVNTGENYQARCFTMFHELAHLSAGEDSACSDEGFRRGAPFNVERWCEEVASACLMPPEALATYATESSLDGMESTDLVKRVAAKFKVSLRASAVALIRSDFIPPSTYSDIEAQAPVSDRDKGFARGKGQRAPDRRRSELGVRTLSIFFDALRSKALSERDAREYLRLDGTEIEELSSQFVV
jgi:Zn-dependent peptidase ImmA (M78 family)/transcriptional regulator with XRE-family HTH domain